MDADLERNYDKTKISRIVDIVVANRYKLLRFRIYNDWRLIIDFYTDNQNSFTSLPARILCAGIAFGGVCLCVCLHEISRTTDQTSRW